MIHVAKRRYSRYMMENLEVILGFLLLYQIGPHSSLTITSLDFPRDVTLGQSVTMTCNFMVRPRQELDSIKWYKDSQEFYRKMLRPEVSVKELFFATPGVKIDKGSLDFMFTNATNAGHHRLTIQHADLTSQGNYRCQITESRNPFHTEQIDQELMVIIRPEEGSPRIKVDKQIAAKDQEVTVHCYSDRSKPAANLAFFLNGERLEDPDEKNTIKVTDKDGLESSSRTLMIKIQNSHLAKSSLEIKCSAKIGDAYWKSTSTIVQLIGNPSYMLESRSSANSGYHQTVMSPILALCYTLLN